MTALRTKDGPLRPLGMKNSLGLISISKKSAPIDLKNSTPQRVLDDMDEQYVCVQVHVRERVRQSMVQVTYEGWRRERVGWGNFQEK